MGMEVEGKLHQKHCSKLISFYNRWSESKAGVECRHISVVVWDNDWSERNAGVEYPNHLDFNGHERLNYPPPPMHCAHAPHN